VPAVQHDCCARKVFVENSPRWIPIIIALCYEAVPRFPCIARSDVTADISPGGTVSPVRPPSFLLPALVQVVVGST
jgi:hypothetical protein